MNKPDPSAELKPSDRAIAQAFWDFVVETQAVPLGHESTSRGQSTFNWRRYVERAILDCARALDAAQPAGEAVAGPPPADEVARDAFERWTARRHGDDLTFWADSGKYLCDITNARWECWKAAIAAMRGGEGKS